MKEYTFTTSGPDILASVRPTMQALGDQTWRVTLSFPSDSDTFADVHRLIEAGSALEAATDAVNAWLEQNGMPTSFSVSL